MTPLSIQTQTPLWVFPVFLGLLVIGARASRARSAPVLLIHALPLMGLLTLQRAQEMGEGMAPGATAPTGLALVFGAVSGSLAGRALRVAFWPQGQTTVC